MLEVTPTLKGPGIEEGGAMSLSKPLPHWNNMVKGLRQCVPLYEGGICFARRLRANETASQLLAATQLWYSPTSLNKNGPESPGEEGAWEPIATF